MKSLIIGAGEVGKGLHKVIGGSITDKEVAKGQYDIIHICYPFSKNFIKYVKLDKLRYNPKYTIIHSTVPIGTTRKIKAIHSPIRGVHPHLSKGIKTFTKYFGGVNADKMAKYYKRFFKTKFYKRSEETEALKLWDTTQYGAMILLNKEIYEWCKKHKVDFDVVYTEANKTYNEGYTKLGRQEVVRPHLKYMKGKIGGHCVYENTLLFNGDTPQKIRKYQSKYL